MRPIKPKRSLADLEKQDPILGGRTRAVLFGLAAGYPEDHGVERSYEVMEDAYDTGTLRIFWTDNNELACIFIWHEDSENYLAYGGNRPAIWQITGTEMRMLNTETEQEEQP